MKISNKQGWKDWQEDGDPKVIAFAQRWAELMETSIERGATVEQVANETMHKANTDRLSVDDLYQASKILTFCWEHGSELLAWKG